MGRAAPGWTVAGTVLAAGCLGPAPAPAPAVPDVAPAGVAVHLVWAAPVDLDLYVTDPAGETFYYGNRGAVFGTDARCDRVTAEGGGREVARWTRPAAGRYRVGVDFPETCDGPDEATYDIVIDVDGRRRRQAGTARLGERAPAAGAFVVP